jgi:hypothetical protein
LCGYGKALNPILKRVQIPSLNTEHPHGQRYFQPVVKDMKNPEAAGYGEYQGNPPIAYTEPQREEKEEQKKADTEPQGIEEGCASRQGHQDDQDPPHPLALG